ncbi:3-hydroxyacyl-ACP dehydratase FabZ family protein [Actinophytocola sediminis]
MITSTTTGTARPLSAVDDVLIGAGGALSAVQTIRADNPYLAGHYPGRPIYPGVFVLESALQATRRLLGHHDLVLAEVESVRFRTPLLPGDTLRLALSITPAEDGYLVRAKGPAATAVLRCVRPTARPAAPVGTAVPRPHPPAATVNVRDLLPHRPPILLTDRVVEHVPGERAVTEFTVRTTEPCYRDLPSELDRRACAYPDSLALESFTQACAVLFLLSRPRVAGTLAFGAARAVRLHEPVFPGQTMRHEVHLTRVVGDTALVHGQTTVDGRVTMTAGTLTVLARDGLARR